MKRKEKAYSGIILDLDGVITDTRSLHFIAWKEMFDEVLDQENSQEFSESDYDEYVDGKPRLDGIRSFFFSRDINKDESSIRELGDKKNKLYLNLLQENGPRVFDDSVEAIRRWKNAGIKVGVISSSKNCKKVLELAKIIELFDIIVDGASAEEKKLKGKPSPEYFMEAARLLELSPAESAIVEDSEAGVKAGTLGKFKSVFGMDRTENSKHTKALKENGAERVIASLLEVPANHSKTKTDGIFHAFESFDQIRKLVGARKPALFFDFDGTLSPIVSDPDKAYMLPGGKERIRKCVQSFQTAIISGRDLKDVKNRVGIEEVFYAGSHGFEISGPGSFYFEMEEARSVLPALENAEKNLHKVLGHLQEVRIERKHFALAVHYREASKQSSEIALRAVKDLAHEYQELKFSTGKKVFELRPNLDWGKGKAIEKICQILRITEDKNIIFYFGDDVTDEDAFEVLSDWGVGISVGPSEKETKAKFWLSDPEEVSEFIDFVIQVYGAKEKR